MLDWARITAKFAAWKFPTPVKAAFCIVCVGSWKNTWYRFRLSVGRKSGVMVLFLLASQGE